MKTKSSFLGAVPPVALVWEGLTSLIRSVESLLQMLLTYIHVCRGAIQIPGPKAYPLIGSTMELLGKNSSEILDYVLTVIAKYPCGRFWLGPLPVFWVTHPRDVERIMNNPKCNDKSYLYESTKNWLGTGLIPASGEVWKRHSKIIAPSFHTKILDSFVSVYNRQTDVFLNIVRKHTDGEVFDLMPLVGRLSLNIICEAAMGVNLNEESYASEYAENVKIVEHCVLERLMRPWLLPRWAWALSARGRRERRALAVVHGLRSRVITARRRQLRLSLPDVTPGAAVSVTADSLGKLGRLAFLDHLLLSVYAGAQLTDQEIAEEVDTFIFAGHDTTSVLLMLAFYEMGQHPQIQDEVVRELESIFDPSQPDIVVLAEHLPHMAYLEMVLKETLRLYPPVSLIARKANEDVKLATCDLSIPNGAQVGTAITVVHRNPEIYPEPNKFDPNRFLPENVKSRPPCSFIPFSSGPRSCLGKRVAMMEAKTIVAKTLWQYRILPQPGFSPILAWGVTTKPINGMMLRIKERRR